MFDQLTMPVDIVAKKRGLWPTELWNGETVTGCPVEGAAPTLRRLLNFCFGLPLVAGDIVEISARLGRNPQVRSVRQLLPGFLLIVDGCDRLGRRSQPGRPDGSSWSDGPVGDAAGSRRDGDGVTGEWYRRVVERLSRTGCDRLETDGDRVVAFWGGRQDLATGVSVVAACAELGIPRENMQLLDHDDREAVLTKFLRMQLHPQAA